jgi:hypothetical protein
MNISVYTTLLQDQFVSNQLALHVIVNGHIASASYTVVAQNCDEVMVPENSPSVSMWPYLLNSARPRRLNHISV